MKIINCLLLFLYLSYFQLYSEDRGRLNSEFFDAEYVNRRSSLIQLMETNSAAVLKAAEPKVRSSDVTYPYRQESNFLYLAAINEPDYILLITQRKIQIGNGNYSVILFAPLNDKGSIFEKGAEIILDKSKFYELFSKILDGLSTLYISAPDYKVVNDWLNNKIILTEKNARNEFRIKYPEIQLKSVTSLVSRLREIKSEKEIEYIQKAVDITGNGILQAIRNCKPGMFEYQIQAEIEYEFRRQGSNSVGFQSIIASGENALILHYSRNNRKMESGDLLLIDVGAEYNGYSADVSRTIPVNGKFTKAQREIYSIVLKAQRETIKIIKPGITLRELNSKTEQVIADAGYKKFIKHSVSHQLGLDVHDVGLSDTLKPGMVITIEPGIYISEAASDLSEEYRGIGIRIEDDILVTSDGFKILSDKIPKEIDEIEQLMKKN